MLKGNKGDWSELYVFIKLLAEGVLFQSDINLIKVKDDYYKIIKIYRKDKELNLEYTRQTDSVVINKINNGKVNEKIGVLDYDYLKTEAQELYNEIINQKGTFEIESFKDFIEKAFIKNLKPSDGSKHDINLRIYDRIIARETDIKFSIKSLLGETSTLFNTVEGNNFIYIIENKLPISVQDFNKITYKPEKKVSKITYRLKKLIDDYNLKIDFESIKSQNLLNNLIMIDGDLPEIISYALLYRWIYRKSSIKEVVELLENKDPMGFYNKNRLGHKFYEHKIKRFLVECAVGMTSETPWDGIYDVTGGIIICKQDGDVVCFHIYDMNLFREYLFNNTKFEQASTGEDKNNPGQKRKGSKNFYYGWLYENDNKLYFDINLQIRFIA